MTTLSGKLKKQRPLLAQPFHAANVERAFSRSRGEGPAFFVVTHAKQPIGGHERSRWGSTDCALAVECHCLDTISLGSIVAMPATLRIVSEEKLMPKTVGTNEGKPLLSSEQFQRELSYRVAVSMAHRLLEQGLISKADHAKIMPIVQQKFPPVWGNCIKI